MIRIFYPLAVALFLALVGPVHGMTQHVWMLVSPDKGQTFVYGSEQSRVWSSRGPDNAKHLALLMTYTNDPYVDRTNPRQYDYFVFNFPSVKLGSDQHTFYYHTADGRNIAVARKKNGFLGISEIHLLPSTTLIVDKPRGNVKVSIVIEDKLIRKDLAQ